MDDYPGKFEQQPDGLSKSLELALGRNRLQLMWWSQEGVVLDRATLWDHQLVVDAAESRGIGWPTLETGFREYAAGQRYFGPNQELNDQNFAREAYEGLDKGGYRGFNSFPVSLGARSYGGNGQSIEDFMSAEEAGMRDLSYGTRPSYIRAHLLAPDFMEALRTEMLRAGDNGWRAAVKRSMVEQATPEDKHLVRSVRFAYGLMINLMDQTDRRRQAEWNGSEGSAELIANPHEELWT